jgi:hypothetical protein
VRADAGLVNEAGFMSSMVKGIGHLSFLAAAAIQPLFLQAAPVGLASEASLALSSGQIIDVRQAPFGARCDWNGNTGSDDTAAFRAAAAAASATYQRTGKAVKIHIGQACELSSTIIFGSGVHWVGPGTIYVPVQKQGVLRAQNADDVAVSGITIDVLEQACGNNNASCSAISWEATTQDDRAHSHLAIDHNIIHHSNWGVLVGYAAGRGSLSGVEITDNQVDSPHAYMDADGIHVGGRVRDFVIKRNTVLNRGDAGIAASSEVPSFVCSDGLIEDNLLLEDQVGLDNSGCTHTLWRENCVRAETSPSGSNPAFRSITYLGLRSSFVTAVGNYLQNAPGRAEFAMKVDEDARGGDQNIVLRGNTILSPLSLYLRGAGIRVEGNVFAADSSAVTIDYDGARMIPTDSIFLGTNRWIGSGAVHSGSNPSLLTHLKVAPQSFATSGTYTGIARPGAAELAAGPDTSPAGGRALQLSIPASNRAAMQKNNCSSITVHAPAAQISMSVSGANQTLGNNSGAITWAFVSQKGIVTVRSCALASDPALYWPRSLAIG